MMDTPYTETQLHADYMNVRVLGSFLEKHPRCTPIKHEYERCKARVEWAREQRKTHVTGRQKCPERTNNTHEAIMDNCIGPTYRCFYCCADMS
jgi:hypothetical protein